MPYDTPQLVTCHTPACRNRKLATTDEKGIRALQLQGLLWVGVHRVLYETIEAKCANMLHA